MGFIWSKFTTNEPDRTGLTPRDKHLLASSWSKLMSNKVALGVAIFMGLFDKHPHYQQLFPFRDIPREELPSNDRFKAHCVGVVYALSGIMDNLQDADFLDALLAKQGSAHVPRGVANGAYWNLKGVLMGLFKQTMTLDEQTAWNKFLDYGIKIIIKASDENRPSSTQNS